ncbi:MAG: DNA primase [Planctomycetes bacterium]|nr:DNA primase [Planctomycetota bacterium]
MTRYVGSEKINEIQKLTDIVEVVGRYVNLKRGGKNYMGLCPFHSEKTPSFSVSPEKQLYKCFGCGEGGNVFTFLMKKEGLSFPEALKSLAEKARVDLPAQGGKDNRPGNKSLIYDTNKFAADFFHKYLLSDKGVAARKYLAGRGIKESSIRQFRLGYAPDAWDSLILLAQSRNIPLSQLQGAGLIIARSGDSGFYDRFRGRLMFPINDHIGRVVGFGGRSLSDSGPKYINSPETALFNKGRCLYGLDLAKPAILSERSALIMEGYTDVIVAHQEGIPNTVGVLGTALTVEHVRLLRQWTPEVTLILDGDAAGRRSSDRSLDILLEEEIETRVVQLPEANDPCDFILKEGRDKFMALASEALDFFSFKMKMAEARHDLSSPTGRINAALELGDTVFRIKDKLIQQEVVKSIAERMSIDEKTFRLRFSKLERRTKGDETGAGIIGGSTNYGVETELLGLLLSHNELIERFEAELGINAIKSGGTREIIHKTLDLYHENGRVGAEDLIPYFMEDEQARILATITLGDVKGDQRKGFEDCVNYIKRREDRKEIGYTKDRMNKLNSNQKKEEAELLREFHERQQRAQLYRKRS